MKKCLLANTALFTILSDLVCSSLDFSRLLRDRFRKSRSVPEQEDIAQKRFGLIIPNLIDIVGHLFIYHEGFAAKIEFK